MNLFSPYNACSASSLLLCCIRRKVWIWTLLFLSFYYFNWIPNIYLEVRLNFIHVWAYSTHSMKSNNSYSTQTQTSKSNIWIHRMNSKSNTPIQINYLTFFSNVQKLHTVNASIYGKRRQKILLNYTEKY